MAVSARMKQSTWDERMKRIQTGRTLVQSSDAEGTIPLQGKRQKTKKGGMRGLAAWIMGGALGWGIGMIGAVSNPAAELTSRVDTGEFAPMIESWGSPVLALVFFLMVTGLLRVRGAFPRFIGIVIMAWVFALQLNMGAPTVAELIEMGQGALSGEESFAGAIDAIRAWAA